MPEMDYTQYTAFEPEIQSFLALKSPLRYNKNNIDMQKGAGGLASSETICARLCLLTRFALKDGMPPPLSRAAVHKMLRLGAVEGLTLRSVPGVKEEYYERARRLLTRSAEIYEKLEHDRTLGYDVLLPDDLAWPDRLRALGAQMPQFLFVNGNKDLLSRCSVSVSGSRDVSDETLDVARKCGTQVADAGFVLVCGGARGVDLAAQRGALDAQGSLILVPAYPPQKLLRQQRLQDAQASGRLLIACDTWPDEPFSAQKALSRNHTIYALGEAALVVASRNGVGGSWRGALDCLRGGYTPVFAVMGESDDLAGNRALMEIGAKEFDCKKALAGQLFDDLEDGYAGKS